MCYSEHTIAVSGVWLSAVKMNARPVFVFPLINRCRILMVIHHRFCLITLAVGCTYDDASVHSPFHLIFLLA